MRTCPGAWLHMKRSINGGLLGKVDDAGTDNHVILLNIKKKKNHLILLLVRQTFFGSYYE